MDNDKEYYVAATRGDTVSIARVTGHKTKKSLVAKGGDEVSWGVWCYVPTRIENTSGVYRVFDTMAEAAKHCAAHIAKRVEYHNTTAAALEVKAESLKGLLSEN